MEESYLKAESAPPTVLEIVKMHIESLGVGGSVYMRLCVPVWVYGYAHGSCTPCKNPHGCGKNKRVQARVQSYRGMVPVGRICSVLGWESYVCVSSPTKIVKHVCFYDFPVARNRSLTGGASMEP